MRPPSNGARALIACVVLAAQVVTWPTPADAAGGQTRAAASKPGSRPAAQSTPRLTPEELALEHYRAGRFDLAIEVLEARVENGGLRGDALLRARELLARSYAGAGRRADAKGVFKVMLYQDPRYRPDPTTVTADERAIFAMALSEHAAEMQRAPQERAPLTPPSSTPSAAPATESGAAARADTGAATAFQSPMPHAMPPQPPQAPPPAPAPARRVYAGASPPPMRVSRPRSSRGWMWWTAGAALAGTATALAVAAGNNRTMTRTPPPGGDLAQPLPGYPPPPP